MQKLSAEQIQQVIGQVPDTLRKLASERDFWKEQAEARIRHDEVMKVATAMQEKGISGDTPIGDLVASLEKAAEAGRLEKIADAVELVGPNMGEKIAHLTNDEGRGQGGSSQFEHYLLGGVG